MTLAQLRDFHIKHHVGFIWQCPKCKELWLKLKQQENKTNEQ